MWHGELLNVNHDDGNGIVSQDVLYIRLAAREYQSMVKNNRGISRLVIVASTVGFGLIMLILLLMIWRNRSMWCNAQLHDIQGTGGGIIAFRYSDLCCATKIFFEAKSKNLVEPNSFSKTIFPRVKVFVD